MFSVPYYQIADGPEELEGIFRYKDDHFFDNKIKKSEFKVVNLIKGMSKEVVTVEIIYDQRIKAAMIVIIYAIGGKQQRSQVVKGKNISDAFPIFMYESKHGWKLMAKVPHVDQNQDHFEFFINDYNFLEYDFIPLTEEDIQ